jgi:hypothetical protein
MNKNRIIQEQTLKILHHCHICVKCPFHRFSYESVVSLIDDKDDVNSFKINSFMNSIKNKVGMSIAPTFNLIIIIHTVTVNNDDDEVLESLKLFK